MGKKKKSKGTAGAQSRTRLNPITGQVETVPGTKAGKRRTRTNPGDPLRTHDLHMVTKKSKKSKEQ